MLLGNSTNRPQRLYRVTFAAKMCFFIASCVTFAQKMCLFIRRCTYSALETHDCAFNRWNNPLTQRVLKACKLHNQLDKELKGFQCPS